MSSPVLLPLNPLVGLNTPEFLDAGVAAAAEAVILVSQWIFVVVVLVVVLSRVELCSLKDARRDLATELVRHFFFGALGNFELRIVDGKHGCRITLAAVEELAPRVQWINAASENVDELLEGHLFGVKFNFDGFDVSGIAACHLLVGGVFECPPM